MYRIFYPKRKSNFSVPFALFSIATVLALLAAVMVAIYFPGIFNASESGGTDLQLLVPVVLLTQAGVWLILCIRAVITSTRTQKSDTIGTSSTDTETELALLESETRFKQLVQNAPVGIITFDTRGRIIVVNSKLVEILGSPSAADTRKINVLKLPQLVEAGLSEDFQDCLQTGKTGLFEKNYTTKWNKNIYLRYFLTPLIDTTASITGAMAIMEDFSNRRAAEEELETLHHQAKQDAETMAILLEEVNHRVKNNLAGIIGMLYATRKFVNKSDSTEEYLSTIENLIHRIEGMATVHEILTEANWSDLPVSELTRRIFYSSLQALPLDKQILTDVIADEKILISPKHASNLGMVINELTTNTIKHALNKNQSAKITVRIGIDGDHVLFQYHNDGPGFPEDVIHLKTVNTGMYLVDTIVKNGLNGTLTLQNDNGALTNIRFKP